MEDDEIRVVICPGCLHEQSDMGVGVACEECGHWPMPHHDAAGELVES